MTRLATDLGVFIHLYCTRGVFNGKKYLHLHCFDGFVTVLLQRGNPEPQEGKQKFESSKEKTHPKDGRIHGGLS